MPRISIDPVTRIEGHLRVEVEVENDQVVDAWTCSTLFRGLEMCMRNRPWRDCQHFSERICGVCPAPHGHNSAFAMEEIAGVNAPPGARLMRNLLECAQLLHDHVLWFYVLNGLDYVDVVSALEADVSGRAQQQVKDRLQRLVDTDQLGFLDNGYFGHPAYTLPPELNLQLVAHYLESVSVQATASEAAAVFGAIFPHHRSTPPGGFATYPDPQRIDRFEYKVRQVKDFIDNSLIPDLMAIAPFYLDQAEVGRGYGNVFSWGVLDEDLESGDPYRRFFPRGAVLNASEGDLTVEEVNHEEDVSVWVTSSWQEQYEGGRHPYDRVQQPDFTGPHGISDIAERDRYAWDTSSLLKGRQVEVGPHAEMLMAYLSGGADHPARRIIDDTLSAVGQAGNVGILFSNLGRVVARSLKVKLVADQTLVYVERLREMVGGLNTGDLPEPFYTPVPEKPSGRGFSGWDAPRGALAHWVILDDGLVENYSVITPSGWNFSPRATEERIRGPVEEALIGVPVVDPERPVEVLRTLHSFDP